MQLTAERFALRDHLREFVAPDGFPETGLRTGRDRLNEVLHFKDRFFRIPDHPENNGIDIHRHGVARQRRFGGHAGDADSLVHEPAERIHNRDHMEQTRSAQSGIAAEAQHGDLLPLIRDFDRRQQVSTGQQSANQRQRIARQERDTQTSGRANHEQRNGYPTHPVP